MLLFSLQKVYGSKRRIKNPRSITQIVLFQHTFYILKTNSLLSAISNGRSISIYLMILTKCTLFLFFFIWGKPSQIVYFLKFLTRLAMALETNAKTFESKNNFMFRRNYGNILYTRRIVARQRQLQTNNTLLHVALKQSRAPEEYR